MGFDDLVRNGIALANSMTADLQATVQHRRWIGQSTAGKPTYATAVQRQALVERRQRRVRMVDGQEILSEATVSFLEPLAAYTPTVTGRRDPIDERDELVLPDGTTGPILKTDDGLFDPVTRRTYMHVVYLG